MRLKGLLCLTIAIFHPSLGLTATTIEEQKADRFIRAVYAQKVKGSETLPQRLDKMSQLFIGRPYLLGALGEGASGQYDQFPLYRTDAFDCLTFVETVLALALSDDLKAFQHELKSIRYEGGQISFIKRNHFTDLDWNKNNQQQGMLKDITLTLHNSKNESVAKMAHAEINKPAWYGHFSSGRIRLTQSTSTEQASRLNALKQRGKTLPIQMVAIPYIPLSTLFDASGKANAYLLQQIPDGAVIEIIRPNWDLTEVIGTHLNVSHLGFGFWHKGELIFRNASTLKGHVVDQSLIEYLREALQSPTIKGINIQVVLPKSQLHH